MFYLFNDRYLYVDKNFNASFTEHDTEGFYKNYLAWVAEGNTAKEWEPETTDME